MSFYSTVESSLGGNLLGKVKDALSKGVRCLDRYEVIPSDAPGLPPPGQDIINSAAQLAGLTASNPDDLVMQIAQLDIKTTAYYAETGKKKRTDILNQLKGVALRSSITALYMKIMYDPLSSLQAEYQNKARLVQTIPGHVWGDPRYDIPTPAQGPLCGHKKLMIIGKFPSDDEFKQCRYLGTSAGKEFARLLEDAGIEDWQDAYVTCLSKFFDNSHGRPGSLPDRWLKSCLPILKAEISIIRPELVVLLGSEPIKAMIQKSLTVTDAMKNVYPAQMDCRRYLNEPEDVHHYHMIACQHPASILHDPDHNTEPVRQSIIYMRSVITSGPDAVAAQVKAQENDIEHTVVPSREYLANLTSDLIRRNKFNFAIDAEWEGRYCTDPNSFMRCVQFSWENKKAALVPICNSRGEYYWPDGWEPTRRILEQLWNRDGVRPIGHNFNADLVWLSHYGLKFLERKFRAPKDDIDYTRPEWRPGFLKLRSEGGWDTMIGQHAVDELSDLSLKALLRRYTTIPDYEAELREFIAAYCKQHKIPKGKITGYGFVPDHMLFKYALYDADGTYRLFEVQLGSESRPGLMDRDRFGLPSWRPFWHTMRALPALLDIHRNGVLVDVPLAEDLIRRFEDARAKQLAGLRQMINWADFKPTSPPQCKALLFGDRFGHNSKGVLIRPEHVKPLDLPPYKTTGKKPKLFANLDPDVWGDFSPSTDKEVMANLDDNPVVKKMMLFRFADQVLKIFRPKDQVPVKKVEEEIDEESDEDMIPDIAPDQQFRIDAVPAVIQPKYVNMDTGSTGYSGGIMSFICHDGRVRTLIFPTTETGRCRSAKPNMQNVTFKRRHKDFVTLLGDDGYYNTHPISSVFYARDGYLFIKADYKGAELVGMAVQAQDRNMIDHCMRNRLPDDHPDHICIHSKVAINAFNLKKKDGSPLRPVAADLKKEGYGPLRDAAKPVDFGYAYGMTAETADRRIREQVDEFIEGSGKLLIEGLEREYPSLPIYYAGARRATQNPGYIQSCYDRRRRFRPTTDRKVIGDQERQGQNFPIQAFVADAVNIAMANWTDLLDVNPGIKSQLALQVHDALMWEVPIEEAEWFMANVLPFVLYQNVSFWPVTFDGRVLEDPNAPYHLAYDVEVGKRYELPFTSPDQFVELGLNPSVFKKL